jgi:hypothetical protein
VRALCPPQPNGRNLHSLPYPAACAVTTASARSRFQERLGQQLALLHGLGNGAQFDDRITEIAVLGVLVLLLGVTSFLLRRKEREPDEGDSSPPAPERRID